jgi:uncharacterized protein (DUF486 family)
LEARVKIVLERKMPGSCGSFSHKEMGNPMENTVESAKAELIKKFNIVQATGLIVGLLYVSGYYINSIFLKNYGINTPELFRLEYIKIGFVFWLIICGLIFLPFGAFYLTKRIRSSSNLPHFWVGLIGNTLNIIVMLGVPIALSFLATKFEWNYGFSDSILGFSAFNYAVSFALAVSVFLVVVLPAVERLVLRFFGQKTVLWIFRIIIEPVRFGGFFLSAFIIYRSVSQVPWLPTVLGKSGAFVAVVLVLGSGLLAAYYWVSFIRKTEGSLMVLPLIFLGVAFFYYLAMASYVYGLYPAIPSNRGGKLPLTQAYLQVNGYDSIFTSKKKFGELVLHGPIYIIEETENKIYFANDDMDKWFEEFIQINVFNKDDVKFIQSERIDDGFPKTSR